MRTRHSLSTLLFAFALTSLLAACGGTQSPDAAADAPGGLGIAADGEGVEAAGIEAEIGFLNINSRPAGIIVINGEATEATTPIEGLAVPVGRHTIQVQFEGSDALSEEQTVMVRTGVSANLFFRDRSAASQEEDDESDSDDVSQR